MAAGPDARACVQLFGMYKRAGQRAIVTCHGDLIVRPAHFEVSMLQTRFHSRGASHHATIGYQRALVAIIVAQLRDSSRHTGGLHGLLALLTQLPQVRHCALHRAVCATHAVLLLLC